MRTELSALSDHHISYSPQMSSRDAAKAYARNKRRFVLYQTGDQVFYRLGAQKPFCNMGHVLHKINDKSYLIKIISGETRIYNQSDLKRHYTNNNTADSDVGIAYDLANYDATMMTPKPSTPLSNSPVASDICSRLRGNKPPISIYKD